MQERTTLGLCFSSRQLFYSINDSSTPNRVKHIGCFDFNFNISKSIRTQDAETFPAVYELIGKLKKEYQIQKIQILTVPDHECWTILPKIVHDNPDEREAHLSIIMKGILRSNLEINWFDLSHVDFKLVAIRNSAIMDGYLKLSENVSEANFVSPFELCDHWSAHHNEKGAFMMIHNTPGLLAISASILGKLRGATYIEYDDPDDLPYLWLYFSKNVKWMNGLFDNVFLYGAETDAIENQLRTLIDTPVAFKHFDTLYSMGIIADEQTYSFSLNSAFPAILLSVY